MSAQTRRMDAPRDCSLRATAAAKRLSPPRVVVISLYSGPLKTQRAELSNFTPGNREGTTTLTHP